MLWLTSIRHYLWVSSLVHIEPCGSPHFMDETVHGQMLDAITESEYLEYR